MKKGDVVEFDMGDGKTTQTGIVIGAMMGTINIMAKDGNYRKRDKDIKTIKGNVFDAGHTQNMD